LASSQRHAVADSRDLAADLEARSERELGAEVVEAATHQPVTEVEGGAGDADLNLSRPGCRALDFFQSQNGFGFAEFVNPPCPHLPASSSLKVASEYTMEPDGTTRMGRRPRGR
jgi:hypothetical protein